MHSQPATCPSQVALFGECVLSEDSTPSKCQQLEEALTELQQAIETCRVDTPEDCDTEGVADKLKKDKMPGEPAPKPRCVPPHTATLYPKPPKPGDSPPVPPHIRPDLRPRPPLRPSPLPPPYHQPPPADAPCTQLGRQAPRRQERAAHADPEPVQDEAEPIPGASVLFKPT